MGKGSNIRRQKEEAQKEYIPNGNGRRKPFELGREVFDPERCPDGCNEDIWHLALYFRDTATRMGIKLRYDSPKIDYGYLQKALTNFRPSDILARVRTTGIVCTWVSVVQRAIEEYFKNETEYDISNLTAPIRFEYYINYSLSVIERELLVTTGKRIPQQDKEVLPSRRTEVQQRLHELRSKKYSEEEMARKMQEFRRRNS